MQNYFKRGALLASLFFWSLCVCYATPYFKLNDNCKMSLSHVFALKFNLASQSIAAEKKLNPENLAVLLAENYIDFIKIFIDEVKSDYTVALKNKVARLRAFEKLPQSEPYKLYAQAEIRLQWAILALKFKDNVNAAFDVKEAYDKLKSNLRRFPLFEPNAKSMGLIEAFSSTIPAKYSFLTKLAGFKSDLKGGVAKLEKFAKNAGSPTDEYEWFRTESRFILVYLKLHLLKDKEAAWALADQSTTNYKTNRLSVFIRANTAMNCGRNDEALRVLKSNPKSSDIYPFHYLEFLHGTAKLRNLDTGAAIHFKRYVVKFKGINYVASAFRSLSWIALLQNNQGNFNTFSMMVRMRKLGNTEEDEQAHAEAMAYRKPDINLLKARLLFDGAYYARSKNLLASLKSEQFATAELKTEFFYRNARVNGAMGNHLVAIDWYLKTIEYGRKLSFYYAANSALMLGMLYEELKNNEKAEQYYRMAINDFSANKEYKGSIEQKSRAGLQRIGKK